MHWYRRMLSQLTGPARRLAALSVLLITVTILLAGCGGGASGVSSGIAPYMMALWLFGLSAVSLFFTGCGGENNGVPGFGQSTVTSTSSSSSSTSGGSTFQAIPTSLTFANTPGSIAQPVAHSATALTKLPPVQVDILDQNGHLDTNATNLVTISLGANPSHATLKGTLTKAAVGGVATFDDLELTLAGAGFTLVASSPGLKGATSAAFNVSALPVNLAYIDRQDYEVGIEPEGVALVDTKGDGSKDLIAVNHYDSTVSVLLGNGDGSFQGAVNYHLPTAPIVVQGADVNGDGHPDLVINANSSKLYVLLGNGDGTFQGPITTSVSSKKFVLGDINGDKVPDLVFTSDYSEVFRMLGNGDGTFQSAHYVTGTGCNTQGITIGDFNNDGVLDIATVNAYCGDVKILLGNGDGTFQLAGYAPFSGESEFRDVTSGDFNGDGKPDLVVSDREYNGYYSGSVHVWLGNGDGTFQSPVNYAVPFNTTTVAVADVDGDGTTDIVTTNHFDDASFPEGTVSVLIGKGDGTFRTSINYEAGENEFAVAVGDVNGDGKADVAVVNADSSTASMFLGAQAGLLSPSSPLPLPIQFTSESNYFNNLLPDAVAVGDLNGDGNPDVVVVSYYGAVTTLLGLGNGTFRAPLNFALEPTASSPHLRAYDLTLVDLNNDGKLDLAVAHQETGQVSIALGNGDGTFQKAKQINMSTGYAQNLAVGDFNKDGKPDLAVSSYYGGKLQILLGNGDGTFQAFANIGTPKLTNLEGICVGDFNHDGNQDIAVCDYDHNNVKVFLGNGDGNFQAPISYAMGDPKGDPQGIAVADVNGDGHLDLVTVNYYDSVSVMLGNGDGTFQAGTCYSIGNEHMVSISFEDGESSMRNVVLADVNADGFPDIVVPQYQEGNVKVLIGNGDGTFQAPISLGTGNSTRAVAVGDLNGDGKMDFVTADYYGDTATVIFHQ